MRNLKYPCKKCQKSVCKNQKGLCCNECNIWVHLKCTILNNLQYDYLENNEDIPFYCFICKPNWVCNMVPENNLDSNNLTSQSEDNPPSDIDSEPNPNNEDIPNSSSYLSLNDSTSSIDTLSVNSLDFTYVEESDSESRGLNFESLTTQCTHTLPSTKNKKIIPQFTFLRSVNYKYPCLVCLSPCKENIHDSICCTLCDEWVHRKCTNLTLEQFKTYCSPEHAEDPYYCTNCLYGNCSKQNLENQICLNASDIESIDINDTIYNLCPNSVFSNKDDTCLSEYYTIEELNSKDHKNPENILLIHINAVSLCLHIESITDMLAELKNQPSIIFISETKLHDSTFEMQERQIQIEGYKFASYHNSPTNAGGTAIYVSDGLKFVCPDINFNYPNCEACFVEIVCDAPGQNQIFGALYRHPGHNARLFCSHLGEFLENFASKGTKLTILGDINIDLNKSNVISNEYMNILNSLGFTTLINQPTRIFHFKDSNTLSCSTLDHLITNSGSSFTKTGILLADVSDHLPIFSLMTLSKPSTNPFKNTFRRSFCENKKEKFLDCLNDRLRNANLNIDPNSLMNKLLLLIKDAINATFPFKRVSNKQARMILNPWMTKDILKEQKKRDNLNKKWVESGRIVNSPEHKNYKTTRNKVVKMVRKARKKYIYDDCKKASGNGKKNMEGDQQSYES